MSTYSFNISSSELLGGSDDDSYQLEVEFYFQPEEPMVMYYPDGSGYPGSAESREIERVLWTRKVGNGENLDFNGVLDYMVGRFDYLLRWIFERKEI